MPTDTAARRVPTQCDHCAQTDDHPKVHLGEDTRHHDCLSADQELLLRSSAQPAGSGPKASAVIGVCKGGTRGAKLVALIVSGDLPQAEGLAEQAQVKAEESAQ